MENKQEIVNHILNKDKVYFSNIYSNHKGMLKDIAFKLTGSEKNSENLIFSTFKELWDSPHSFQDSSDNLVSTYLMKRLIYNYLSSQRTIR
ncbi:hypothetical protein J7J00_25920 [Bacillus sp. ISL-4]|uniref:sigma factor n=1 Tax=Bacillus sp. ISL-4 TaxID=2819125 RepID=UPI001BE5C752|nr:sigma factor [Bacillus sp. ISL-4]MBT2668840.1 hypothetical protein [Bacillus sp. ISL-4]MBT2669409.1 hypothetical protein [Streptomyces sp. ISL-14]